MEKQKSIAVILCGPPGSGKGRLRKSIVAALGWHGVEMSKVLDNDPIFKAEERSFISNLQPGDLFPNTPVRDALVRHIEPISTDANIVFDGATRTLEQLQFLSEWLLKRNYMCYFFQFDLDETVCRKRIAHRAKVEGRPDDLDEFTVNNRFIKYYSHLPAILKELLARGRLMNVIDGTMAPEEIFQEVCIMIGVASPTVLVEK